MLFYFLQTSLMLLVAYFLGCWLGCVLRHNFGASEPVPVRAGDARPSTPAPATYAPTPAPAREPYIAPQPRAATATEPVFRRTDLQTASPPPPASVPASPPPVSVVAPVVTVAPAAPQARPVEVRPTPAPVAEPVPAPVPVSAPVIVAKPAPIAVPAAVPAAPAPAPATAPRPAAVVTGVSVTAAAAAAAAAAVAQGRAREATIGKPPAEAIRPTAAPAAHVTPPTTEASLPAAGASSGVSGVAVGGQARHTAPTGIDDLKRIRGVGPEIEAALHRIGVRRYGEVAGWSAGDVDNVSKTLGLKGRIEHENWIEQAQVLSKGGETAFSRRYDRGEMEMAPPPKVQSASTVVAPAVAAPVLAPAPKPVEVPAPASAAPAPSVAMSSQSAVTAAAVAAAAAAQRVMPAVVAPAAASPDRVRELSGILAGSAKPAVTPAVSAAVQPPVVQPPAAPKQPPIAPGVVAAVAAPAAPIGDDLTRIRGIDRDMAQLLAERGIVKFAQIGAWTNADADRFGSALLLKLGRVQQESWIDQARLLAGMGPAPAPAPQHTDRAEGAGWHQRAPNTEWTPEQKAAAAAEAAARAIPASAPAASPMPAPVAVAAAAAASAVAAHAAPAIAAVAPVLAPVLTPVAAPQAPVAAAAGGTRVVRSGVPDDLKRIKGIGVVLEKKLHGLGIINYGQIAGWAQADIDKMSDVLDFKGRIERENWIEQARILATGGITDFARRVDRGEVETGSPRPVR